MKIKAIEKRIIINHFGMGKEKKGRANKKTKEKGRKDGAKKRKKKLKKRRV
jgi:hypothetical protein